MLHITQAISLSSYHQSDFTAGPGCRFSGSHVPAHILMQRFHVTTHGSNYSNFYRSVSSSPLFGLSTACKTSTGHPRILICHNRQGANRFPKNPSSRIPSSNRSCSPMLCRRANPCGSPSSSYRNPYRLLSIQNHKVLSSDSIPHGHSPFEPLPGSPLPLPAPLGA